MKAPEKTARFAQVVQTSGTPEPVTLWRKPEDDPLFMAAVRQERVMTVKQENVGSRKDFAVVGFEPERNVSYLIFPKSLKTFAGRRIIGVKYDLLKASSPAKTQPPQRPKALHKAARPPAKSFEVIIRCIARLDLPVEVESSSRAAARRQALEQTKGVDFSAAPIERRAVRIRQIS